MKKNKKSILLSSLCGAIVLTAAVGAISASPKDAMTADAATLVFEGGQFAQEYAYGQAFVLPDSAKIEYGGKEYDANKGYIIYPDGCAHSGAESYTLDQVGKYTLVYQVEVGGKIIAAEQNFSVDVGLYGLDADSSLEYDTLRAFSIYKDLTAEERAEGLRMGVLETDVKGLNIYLASNTTFTYNKPINIYENTTNSILEFNSIQLEPEVKSWTIRLTDCYDPTIFIDVFFSKVAIDETYARLSANGLSTVGLQPSKGVGDVTIDGTAYDKANNGTPVRGNRSIDKTEGLGQDRYNNTTIRLDTTDRKAIKVYLDCISARGEEAITYLVGQLNNESLFPYAFNGFTNGDVYLSLTAKDFSGVQIGEFEIKSIMGVSGEGLIPKDYKDETPPEIKIDAPAGDINLIAGVPIKIPAATAIDASGVRGNVDYTVWYAYGTNSERMVQVKDGQFTPTTLGEYVIEYYVCDVYGNKATESLKMYARKEGEEAILFTCNNISDVSAGEFVKFDDYTIETLTQLRNFEVKILCPNGETLKIADPSADFRLSSAGEYTVTYTYADALYEGEYSYSFEAKDAGIYSFEGGVILPKYFIKGASYTLEMTKLYRYSGLVPEPAETKAYVRYGTGSYTEIDAAAFTVTGSKKVTIKYVCVEDESVFIESDKIEIIDVGYNTKDFDKSKYFKGSFTASTSEEVPDRTTYTYNITDITTKPELDFINVLSLKSFGIKFAIPEGQKTKAVSLILTDYYDRSNQVVLTIAQKGTTASYSFNDGESVNLADGLIGAPLNVSYNGAGQLQIGNMKVACPISFTTDLCLLTVKITGLSNGNKFEVLSVCNQQFGYYIFSDTAKPIISAKMPENVAKIGDVISIEKPVYTDVFSPNVASYCTVTVYKNGKVIQATNGETLKGLSDFDKNYAFKIDGYGSYLIVYQVVDGAGKKQDLRHTVTVTDNEAPTITLNDYNGSAIDVAVGEKTSVIAYTASDNYTSAKDLEIWAFVYDEKGRCVSAEKGTFTVSKAGKYTVQVYCIDEAGNTAYATYEIKAK